MERLARSLADLHPEDAARLIEAMEPADAARLVARFARDFPREHPACPAGVG